MALMLLLEKLFNKGMYKPFMWNNSLITSNKITIDKGTTSVFNENRLCCFKLKINSDITNNRKKYNNQIFNPVLKNETDIMTIII